MQPTFNPRRRALVFLATALSAVGPSVLLAAPQAANLVTVYKLGTPTGSGTNPRGDLLLASDGNLYAATYSGGAGGAGTVLQITPAGAVTVLHSFLGGATEGATPYAGLIEATDGALYGTTYLAGADSFGTVFKVTKAGAFTNLHSFDNAAKGGFLGYAGLLQAPDGDLYGSTLRGGKNDLGTVFKLTTAGGSFAELHSFAGGDGKSPEGRLALGPDGALYGTTLLGGAADRGTIYKITTSGTLTTLYSFSALGAFTPAGVAVNPDGANPRAGLVLGTDGNFYGTSYQGGAFGYGTVFRLTPAGAITTLHSFEGAPYDGSSPLATVSFGADGTLYGTTERGGYGGQGTAWQIDTGGAYRLLYSFTGLAADGGQIYTTLVPLGGFLYGAAYTDNAAGTGVLYKLDLGTAGVPPLVFGVLPETIELGASATLTYSSPTAASCTSAGTNWTDAITTAGTKTLTPTAAGIYTYVFTCKDGAGVIRNANASLVVTAPEAKPVDGGGDGGGGALSWLMLALLGGASLFSASTRKRLDHERA